MALARLRQAARDGFSVTMGKEYVQVANCQGVARIRIFLHFSLDRGSLYAKIARVTIGRTGRDAGGMKTDSPSIADCLRCVLSSEGPAKVEGPAGLTQRREGGKARRGKPQPKDLNHRFHGFHGFRILHPCRPRMKLAQKQTKATKKNSAFVPSFPAKNAETRAMLFVFALPIVKNHANPTRFLPQRNAKNSRRTTYDISSL